MTANARFSLFAPTHVSAGELRDVSQLGRAMRIGKCEGRRAKGDRRQATGDRRQALNDVAVRRAPYPVSSIHVQSPRLVARLRPFRGAFRCVIAHENRRGDGAPDDLRFRPVRRVHGEREGAVERGALLDIDTDARHQAEVFEMMQ